MMESLAASTTSESGSTSLSNDDFLRLEGTLFSVLDAWAASTATLKSTLGGSEAGELTRLAGPGLNSSSSSLEMLRTLRVRSVAGVTGETSNCSGREMEIVVPRPWVEAMSMEPPMRLIIVSQTAK